MGDPVVDAMASRRRGRAGRLEAWYTTLSDPATGLGCWVHHETVAPSHGDAYHHGWAAVFRPEMAPVLERFGPEPATDEPPRLSGAAGRLTWDLHVEPNGAPLFTFSRWAWERELLPAAQIVPVPGAPFRGTLTVDGEVVGLSRLARGAVAHIYGRGNAQRWGWLHADLGGGDVLEIVSAVSRHGPLRQLPPLALVQLRLGGRDWPRDPLAAAPFFRTRLALPTWTVRGDVGRWRLSAEVTVPHDSSVRVGYVDHDGSSATCTNSERADARISLEHRRSPRRWTGGGDWEAVEAWDLRGTAHAEVGTRP